MSEQAPDGGPASGPDASDDAKAADAAGARLRRRYTWKVGLTVAGLFVLALGSLLTIVFALDVRVFVEQLRVDVLTGWLREHLPPDWNVADGIELITAAVLNLAAFLVAVVIAAIAGISAGRDASKRGEFSAFGSGCVALTRNTPLAGLVEALAGILVATLGVVFILDAASLVSLLVLLPGMSGVALALVAIGVATALRIDYLIDPPRPQPPPGERPADLDRARITGLELLEKLRASPIYRRQVAFDRALKRVARYTQDDSGLAPLLARYPRIRPILHVAGIEKLTGDQIKALGEILESERATHTRSIDHVLVGWPGSGRSTLANLLSLAAVLHREGAMHCVTAESAARSTDAGADGLARQGARHPSIQLWRWLRAAGLVDQVRVEEAYDDPGASNGLDLRRRPDIVFTDARMLSDAVLKRVGGDARELIARLRYVVVDHPDRLPRAELIRLRLAIARLRMTAELFGRAPTFILLLPHLGNSEELAKFLLNNEEVPFHKFSAWPEPVHLVGWTPPLEVVDNGDEARPLVARASFTNEAIALLSEIGYESNLLREETGKHDLRVAVVDAKPLLGPEAREHIRISIPELLSRDLPPDVREKVVQLDWTYLGTCELAVDVRRHYDVIVAFGVGSHPEHLVSSLRPAVATDGAIFVVGDSSAADQEGIRRMADDAWDPVQAVFELKLPSRLVPDHSDAVIAHEMASLFEDFHMRPLPEERLCEVFPGAHTPGLLRKWQATRCIEAVDVFELAREGLRPEARPYLRRRDPTFTGERYKVPWGCSSRRLVRVIDESAHARVKRRRHADSEMDRDRLFIDFFPKAYRRYPPSTVQVQRFDPAELSRGDREAQERCAVVEGTVYVSQPEEEDAIRVDRRAPVFDSTLVEEWPLGVVRHVNADDKTREEIRRDALFGFLRTDRRAEGEGDEARRDRDVLRERREPGGADERRLRLVDDFARPSVAGTATPALLVRGGMWACRVRESLRNVVLTDERLVEEPDLVGREDLPRALRLTREVACTGVSLFLVRPGDKTDGKSELPLEDRAAYHGLARAFAAVLAARYVNFHDEMRVIVVPNAPAGADARDAPETAGRCPGGYRILVHGLHSDELGARGAAAILDAKRLRDILIRTRARLERCDCDDGCSACCGGLGTIPRHLLPRPGFEPQDGVSRKGAYLLVSALLGQAANWDAFYEGQRRRRRPTDAGPGPSASDSDLARLVAEILGQPKEDGAYQGGLWPTLFRGGMPMNRSFVANACWSSELAGNVVGCYKSGQNLVCVRPGMSADMVRETIVHEYCHNWQFKSDGFDLPRLYRSDEVAQFFEGKLVIEGHATWSDHQYRFHRGLGASYSPGDGKRWNEYKVGYMLFEGIEKALGQAGLLRWLAPEAEGGEPEPIRSRHPRLKGRFTVTQAVEALGLAQAARAGRYSGFDVGEAPEPAPGEEGAPGAAGVPV